jgi:hypothetical protein
MNISTVCGPDYPSLTNNNRIEAIKLNRDSFSEAKGNLGSVYLLLRPVMDTTPPSWNRLPSYGRVKAQLLLQASLDSLYVISILQIEIFIIFKSQSAMIGMLTIT